MFYVQPATQYGTSQQYTPAVTPTTPAIAATQLQSAAVLSQSPSTPQKEGKKFNLSMYAKHILLERSMIKFSKPNLVAVLLNNTVGLVESRC